MVMARYEAKDIRNVAIVGHNSSGKTTLADAMLFKAKAVPRMGSIDEGTSVFDFDSEARDRKVSIELSIASCSFKSREINIIDTPGYADFIAQAISALSASEGCLVCINATSGIMLNTRKTWEEAAKRNLARIIVVTKLDNENIDLQKLIGSIRSSFGQNVVPINLPNQTGPGISQVVSVFESAPAGYESLVSSAKEKILETNDALLEKYLEGKDVSREEIEGALKHAVSEGKIIPLLCTCVTKGVGVGEVLEAVADLVPPPKVQEKFSAQVFKCTSDPFVGKLVYLKIVGAALTSDMPLYNERTKRQLKMGNLFKPFGKDQRSTPSVVAGDIAVITKLEEALISDTFCDPANPVKYPDIPFPTPMISLAVEPKTKQDEARISIALQKMADSDPTFKAGRDQQTLELVITAMSQLHLDVTLARMRRIYEVNVITKTPKIPFKESVMSSAGGHHKHKKQTGGHGQYGEVYIKIEPVERGKGFEFLDEITQGKIPSQYVPSVEKGIRETLEKGVIAGYPVTDVCVRLTDGSYHEVDSGPESFRIAGSKAFKAGFLAANPVLLEPVVNLQVYCPARFIGDVTGQLTSRRGRIQTVETDNDMQIVKAQAPLMEVANYSTELNTITAGEGYFTMELSHYDVLPHRIAEGIIAKSKKQQEAED
jgi:elongation factor G